MLHAESQNCFMNKIRIALTTCSDAESAASLASQLVERGVAACVNIVPGIRSIYRWQGKIEDDSECLLIIKTTVDRMTDIKTAITELHDYDVPECIVLPVETGTPAYLNWVVEQTAEKQGDAKPDS